MDTWRDEIDKAMQPHGETFADVVHIAAQPTDFLAREARDLTEWAPDPDDDEADYASYPVHFGFTLWTARRVYFPAEYDGACWVTSVPREPCNEWLAPV